MMDSDWWIQRHGARWVDAFGVDSIQLHGGSTAFGLPPGFGFGDMRIDEMLGLAAGFGFVASRWIWMILCCARWI